MSFLFLLACTGTPTPPAPPTPEAVAPSATAAATVVGLGVQEIATPANILRATEVKDLAPRAYLDVWFEPDRSSLEGLRSTLMQAGFEIVDGDGESWRVRAPEGQRWLEQLAALPDVRRVTEALFIERLPSGATREGSAHFGEVSKTWTWGEGGPQQHLTGMAPPPPEPTFPQGSPTSLIRCLSPLRDALLDGVDVGPGWERALLKSPPAWVIVLEDYGACKARGYLVLRSDGALDTLTVGGKPVLDADDVFWWGLAADYLSPPRADEDPAAMAAYDLLRKAPDDALVTVLPRLAPGSFQRRLFDGLAQHNPGAAAALANTAASPVLQARAAAEDAEARRRILSDPKASTIALAAVLSIWRPGPNDDPALLARLQQSPDATVRRLAWERTLDATMTVCAERVSHLDSLSQSDAEALYRDCPQQPVRGPAFQAVAAKDKAAAGKLVAATLENPETLLTGIAAVRHANALERDDLLAALVARDSIARDIRRVALELLVKAGRYPQAAELVAKHGNYLGYHPPLPPGPLTAGE